MPNQINRDIYVLTNKIKEPIDYVRGTNAIPIVFHFRDYDIPSGSIAAVYVKKPSGNAVYNNASVSGNDVTVDVTTQMFAEFGQNIMQIQISKNNDNLVTFSQPVNVHENNTDEDAPKSENESTILQDVKAATAAANEAAESANDAAEEAESKAQAADQAAQGANEASQQIQQNAAAGNYSASVSVGTVTTGDPGTQAQIYNSGTKKDAIFNFIIPQGPQGETGLQGPEGPQGPAGSLDDIETATVTFLQASSRTNIDSGDSIGTLFGKIQKWFADMRTAAFLSVTNTLTKDVAGYVLDARQGKALDDKKVNKESIVNNLLTTKSGYVLDARQGKVLNDKINKINSDLSDVIYDRSDLPISDFYTVADFDLRRINNQVFVNLSLTIDSGTQFEPNTLYSIGQSPVISELKPLKTYYLNGFGCGSNWDNATALSVIIDNDGYIKYTAPSRSTYLKISGHWFTD